MYLVSVMSAYLRIDSVELQSIIIIIIIYYSYYYSYSYSYSYSYYYYYYYYYYYLDLLSANSIQPMLKDANCYLYVICGIFRICFNHLPNPEQAPDGPAATVPGLARQTETDH